MGRFDELSEFISDKMVMSHYYQPAMLIELLSNDGEASVEDIAKALMNRDQTIIEYYEIRAKGMVGKVLTDNRGITERIKENNRITGFRLNGFDELSREEIKELKSLCVTKIEDYVQKRGERLGVRRDVGTGYVSGTIQNKVLTDAKGRCALCGISKDEKYLQVDHIIPRSLGGPDVISNFQALCYTCNAQKGNRDDTDLRNVLKSYEEREPGCLFCEIAEERVIASNELCYAIRDGYPVTELHTLVIPKRHVAGFFELHQPEINAIHRLLRKMKVGILERDSTVTSFNIGVNSGEEAGQTINHCHFHLIPRRKGDVDDPTGGVRGVIPEKQNYTK